MIEGNVVLDGYEFGSPDSKVVILEDGFDGGYADVRTQDAEMPRGDGVLMGRDYLGAPTWGFTLGVRDDENVYETLAELARVWRADHVRKTPGAVSELHFSRGGKRYVAFGRPRRFAVTPQSHADHEFQIVDADYQLIDPFVYSSEEKVLRMGLIEAPSTGGLVLPAVLPWELGSSDIVRKGIVTVAGYTETPLKVRIYGPTVQTTLTDPEIKAPGFNVKLNYSIASGQVVEIDTRTRTVTTDGLSLAGHLSANSRLGTKLQPGSTEFTFSGLDDSNTSQVEFLWREAEYSL